MKEARKWSLWIVALTMHVALSACGPTEEEMQAKQAEISALQAKLKQSEERGAALDTRVNELDARNKELTDRLDAAGAEKGTLNASLAEKDRALEELRQREKQAQDRLKTFQQMLDKFKAMIETGKLRVRVVRGRMVVELSENILFDSGKSDLKKEGEDALTQVADVLKSIDKRDFQIAGHTDNIPIKSAKFPSNWELSTARAVEVTKFLGEKGVPFDRLSAAGYADTLPVAPNTDAEGRKQNRRIEIVLMPNLDELPDLSGLTSK